jgi:hypothetical protein
LLLFRGNGGFQGLCASNFEPSPLSQSLSSKDQLSNMPFSPSLPSNTPQGRSIIPVDISFSILYYMALDLLFDFISLSPSILYLKIIVCFAFEMTIAKHFVVPVIPQFLF